MNKFSPWLAGLVLIASALLNLWVTLSAIFVHDYPTWIIYGWIGLIANIVILFNRYQSAFNEISRNKGVKGECYPCDKEIFDLTYDETTLTSNQRGELR